MMMGVVTALYYLAEEAQRQGRSDVRGVLRKAIVQLEAMEIARRPGEALVTTFANPQTCAIIEFFDQYLRASPESRAAFLKRTAGSGG